MYRLKYTEFYITNVCNLNCPNCNRFNNYAFSGHFKWKDNEDEYAKWAKRLEIDRIGILGGEPTTNPDYINWIQGVMGLWKNSKISIITNGTSLDKQHELYGLLEKHSDRMFLEVTAHGDIHVQQVFANLKKFLKQPVSRVPIFDSNFNNNWKVIRDESWPKTVDKHTWKLLPQHIIDEVLDTHMLPQTCIDSNGVIAVLTNADSFVESAIIGDGRLRLHNNNPCEAVSKCLSKYCHHFMNGKLYKCGTVALLPEFAKQFNLIVSQNEDELMHSYQPATASDSNIELSNFINNLTSGDPVPQCQFCTVSDEWKKFEVSNKKPKIPKITNK